MEIVYCRNARLFQQKAILWTAMWHDVFPEFYSASEKRRYRFIINFRPIKISSGRCNNDSN